MAGLVVSVKRRCEQWGHLRPVVESRCQAKVMGTDGRLYPCLSRAVAYCESCGVPVADCAHQRSVSRPVNASESAVSGPVSVTCSCCGSDLSGRNVDTRFCSGRCRQRSRRGRCVEAA
jgi:hypothetical protein